MRPIPAPRIGDSHGLLRAIGERERIRLDEFLTSANVDDMFPEGLENALGRMRQFVSFARAAGLVREDRGVVELTEIGRRYVRAVDPERPFDVSPPQAEWLRRQLVDKHMTDSIFHGLAIGLSLLASNPAGSRIATLDFGRALAYLGRAGWDNENTLRSQGERYLVLLRDMEMIDDERAVTPTGTQTKGELTLPVHMSLPDIAAQHNPRGVEGVRADGEAEWAALAGEDGVERTDEQPATPSPPPPVEAAATSSDDEYEDVGPGSWVAIDESVEDEPASAQAVIADEPAVAAAAEEAVAAAAADEPDVAGGRDEPSGGDAGVAAPVEPPSPVGDAGVAAPVEPPSPVGDAGVAAPVEPPSPGAVTAFLDPADIRAVTEKRGLRLPSSVHASIAAALGTGRHLLLVGAPGAGKTTLALAVAEAAALAGRAAGAALITATRRWEATDLVVEAAGKARWLVVDELDRAHVDRSLGGLSSFLAGRPVVLPGATGEVRAAADWRLIATAADIPHRMSAALLGRFAVIPVPAPGDAELTEAIRAAAAGDEVAAAAARRLLPLRDLAPLGAGVFLTAARHGAAHRATEPVGESALTRELYAAYVEPLLGRLDDERRQRVDAFLASL